MQKGGLCEFLGTFKDKCKDGCAKCYMDNTNTIEICMTCTNFAEWYYSD